MPHNKIRSINMHPIHFSHISAAALKPFHGNFQQKPT